MRIICTTISIIFAAAFITFTVIMSDNTLSAQIENIPNTNSVIYSIIIGLSAFLSGFMFSQAKIEQVKSEANKQIRKSEKHNLDAKESLDKIERLNSKIETLETALQQALNSKNRN